MSLKSAQRLSISLTVFALAVLFVAGCGSISISQPPKFLSSSPASGATGVHPAVVVEATFSKNISISGFVLTSQNGNIIKGTVSGSGSSTVAFTPDSPLNFGTRYTAKVSNVVDSSGSRTADVTWSFTTVRNNLTYFTVPGSQNDDAGRYNATAVSPADGKTYVSYFNATTKALYVVSTADGASFSGPHRIDAPTSRESVGQYSSLAVDAAGNLHISYYHGTAGLKYATASDSAGAWSTTVIDPGSPEGTHSALALDAQGKVHISYYDTGNTALKYATNAGGSWKSELVDSGLTGDSPGQFTSIGIAADGTVHISYYDLRTATSNGNLKYIAGTFGHWAQPLTLDSTGDVGKYSSLALSGGKVYIAYDHLYPDGRRFVRIITNASGEWRRQDVVEVSTFSNDPNSLTANPLVMDAHGTAHISYFKDGVLYYNTGVLADIALNTWDWAPPLAVDSSQLGQGIYISLALDRQGDIRIAYYDATDGDLKFAR